MARISPRPPLSVRPLAPVPPHLRDLSLGNPDLALLPPLHRALGRLPRRSGLYGEAANRPALSRSLPASSRRRGSRGAPSRSRAARSTGSSACCRPTLRPGDRIAVEDPGYVAVFDLVAALGLVTEPVRVDDSGSATRRRSLASRGGRASGPAG